MALLQFNHHISTMFLRPYRKYTHRRPRRNNRLTAVLLIFPITGHSRYTHKQSGRKNLPCMSMPGFHSTDYFSLLPWISLYTAGYFTHRLFAHCKLLTHLESNKANCHNILVRNHKCRVLWCCKTVYIHIYRLNNTENWRCQRIHVKQPLSSALTADCAC